MLLQALQYCHHRGVLHRDVKPGAVVACRHVFDVQDVSRALSAWAACCAQVLLCLTPAGNFCVDVGDAQDRVALTSAYVVLVDFGFAQSLPQSLQLQSEFGGTPDYASHRCYTSGRSTCAACCALYQAATGTSGCMCN